MMVPMFYILIITIMVIMITYLVNNHYKNRRFWKLLDEIYGYKTLPLIGNAHQFGSTTEDFLWKPFKVFEEANYTTYKLVLGSDVLVGLVDPDTIEVLLSNNKEINKMEEYNYMKDWLGDGLLISTGAKWRTRRKIITPTFHFKILEQFVKIFNDNGDIFVKQLSVHEGKIFDVYPFVNVCTLDVICESAMGVSINAQTNSNSEYVKAVHSICKLVTQRTFSPLKRFTWYYKMTSDYKQYCKDLKILHGMTNSVIKKRKDILKEQIDKIKNGEPVLESHELFFGQKKKVAFLDLLLLSKLPDGTLLSDEDVREEVDTFMFEGHDTTASAISFTLYCLANHPEVQKKAFEEVIGVVGDDPTRELKFDDLQKLKYMEMVIKETLRLYPSVPGYGRRLENDLHLPDGKIIPGGCLVFVDTFALGRNPRHYENHDKFDPERFSPENWTGKHPFLFVPFSAGSRNCIGQKYAMLELKSALSKTLLNYELLSSGENVRIASEIILKAPKGVKIIIKRRKMV